MERELTRYPAIVPRLDPRHVRDYAGRAWGLARDAKRQYWRARRGDVEGAIRVTTELARAMLAADSSWADAASREEDHQTHERVAEALARTAPKGDTSGTAARRARGVRAGGSLDGASVVRVRRAGGRGARTSTRDRRSRSDGRSR
jgi:hypothetical protein